MNALPILPSTVNQEFEKKYYTDLLYQPFTRPMILPARSISIPVIILMLSKCKRSLHTHEMY
jgi:hypothetical protein